MAAAVASAPAADVVGVQLGIANALGTATTLLMQCAGCIFLHGTKHQMDTFNSAMRLLRAAGEEYERRFPSKDDDRHFSKKTVRGHVGAPAYSLQQLFSFMNLGRLLKDKREMKDALQRSFEVISGDTGISNRFDGITGDAPSAATISRSSYKLDTAHMLLRQQQWQSRYGDEDDSVPMWIVQLGFDASALKKEFFLCQEICQTSEEALHQWKASYGKLAKLEATALDEHLPESDELSDSDEPTPSKTLEVRVLPPVTLGKGFTSTHHKVAGLLHMIKLEVGNQKNVESYCRSVVSLVSDQGTERGISNSCKINLSVVEHNDAEALGTTRAEEGRQVVVQEDDQSLLNQFRQQGEVEEGEVGVHPNLHDDDPDQDPEVQTLFPNAIQVLGLKHICDNMMQSALSSMELWDQFIEDLRQVEHLLRDRMMRERFQALCIPKNMAGDIRAFKTWCISLKSLRWEQTVNFCGAAA